MTFVLWVVRVLVILMVVRMLFRAFTGRLRTPAARRAPRIGGALVRDPECGTYLPPARAVTLGSGASAVYFCSTTCRDAWTRRHADVAR